ncbi:RDD family protein [Rhodococcus sp. NPDC127528]|uniref:RDD family protein n=1 Tax=unclassified Rhodococcus (in: high G+C Gram-positive bacteria) TaxID=192944 RepID=UPI00363EB6B9
MARMTGSWLSGPTAALPKEQEVGRYRGEKLGLPESGPGAAAGTGRRVLALAIDWAIGVGVASLLVRGDWTGGLINTVALIVWFVVGVGAVSLFAFTPGQFAVGIGVARVDRPVPVGFVRALVRQVLLVFVVPALITDHDGRGMHDRATGTMLIRSR